MSSHDQKPCEPVMRRTFTIKRKVPRIGIMEFMMETITQETQVAFDKECLADVEFWLRSYYEHISLLRLNEANKNLTVDEFNGKLPKCFVGYLPCVISRLSLLCMSWPRPSLIKLLKEIAEHFPGLVPKILGVLCCELEHGQTNPMAYYLSAECRKGKRLVLTRSYLETHLGSLEICRSCGLEVESL